MATRHRHFAQRPHGTLKKIALYMQTTTQTQALQIIDSLITSIELAEKQLQLLPTVTPEIKIQKPKTPSNEISIFH